MATKRIELLGMIVLDAVGTIAQIPDAALETTTLKSKTVIVDAEFEPLFQAKMEELSLEIAASIKARGAQPVPTSEEPTAAPAGLSLVPEQS